MPRSPRFAATRQRPSFRSPRRAVVVTALTALIATAVPAAVAAFLNSSTATSTFSAAADWMAPLSTGSVIAKTTGYLAGAIKQGGTYYLYANVTDGGNPPSGTASVAGDTTAITAGAGNVALISGTWSVNGVTYNYRSEAVTAGPSLSAGGKNYSVGSADVAGNSRVQTGYTVVVDNTAPTATDVQTTNVSGGTAGRAQPGDTVTFTFSEQIDPESILPEWTGAAGSVVVRLVDGGCTLILCSSDRLVVYDAANSNPLPFGTLNLNRIDYNGDGIGLGQDPTITFGASGTASSMVQSGSAITITLGTASGTANTAGGTGTMTWDPVTTWYDAAGNTAAASNPSESGAGDREF